MQMRAIWFSESKAFENYFILKKIILTSQPSAANQT